MLVAKVIVGVALPRHLGLYDYTFDDKQALGIGTLVEIVFRGRRTWGLVAGLGGSPPTRRLASIERVVASFPLLPPDLISLMLEAGAKYAVSPALILKRLFPATPPASLAAPPQTLLQSGSEDFLFSWRRIEALEKIREIATSDRENEASTLIVSPDLGQAHSLINELSSFQPYLLSSGSGASEFWQTWNCVISRASLVIATSLAPFIPAYQLRSIIIDREEDARHKHPDENPRLDRRRLLTKRVQDTGGRLIHILESARIDPSLPLTLYPNQAPTDLVSTTHHATTRQKAQLLNLIETLDKGDETRLAVIVPGRGYAKRLACSDCGEAARCRLCHSPVYPLQSDLQAVACGRCAQRALAPTNCSRCHGLNWRYVGWGRSNIAAEVSKNVLVTGAGSLVPGGLQNPVSHIVLAFPEYMIREDDWRADERLLSLILQAAARARDLKANLHIITALPEHISLQSALSGKIKDFVERESSLRQSFSLPPAVRLITLAYPKARTTLTLINKVKSSLETKLAEGRGTMTEMVQDRGWGRKRPEGLLVIKIPRDLPYTSLFEDIPATWVIDVDPEVM